ncbi:MAG: MBL fold metallo-hydrolase [Dehalococcoidia bacterium]|nr:MBL fold metallo-hydrolase [Dehalococcoidia bacterium]
MPNKPSGLVKLQFLGAAGTVTGSKFLLTANDRNYLIDCGLFQGADRLEQQNWQPLSIAANRISAVILTHAHLDHSGYLPRLVKLGYKGPVYASEATGELMKIILPDSGYLQEEGANYANKHGYSRHKPALPLYTSDEAYNSMKNLYSIQMNSPYSVDNQVSVTMRPAGHILGSAILDISVTNNHARHRYVFSGDLGRYGMEITKEPSLVSEADYLALESTYGAREHVSNSFELRLESVVNETHKKGGVLIIPSSAVGRTQSVLFYLRKLESDKKIPIMPVYVDSPMAVDATEVYLKYKDEHNLNTQVLEKRPLISSQTRLIRKVEESKELNEKPGPMIIISSSGMLEGGRVMHHLKNRIGDPNNTVLLVGFQPTGTRGRMLMAGAKEITIHGEKVPVIAKVVWTDELSAHADFNDSLRWLSGFNRPPKTTFLVHGEPDSLSSLREKIENKYHWTVKIPEYLESFTLD